MGRKGNYDKQHDGEYTFTRAAWEMFKDTELEYEVHITIAMVPTAQRGVFFLEVTAWSRREGEQGRKLGSIQGSYPNGRSGTMSAYLFALSNSLGQMIANVRGTEYEDEQAST